jgi:hypothetical protein
VPPFWSAEPPRSQDVTRFAGSLRNLGTRNH